MNSYYIVHISIISLLAYEKTLRGMTWIFRSGFGSHLSFKQKAICTAWLRRPSGLPQHSVPNSMVVLFHIHLYLPAYEYICLILVQVPENKN